MFQCLFAQSRDSISACKKFLAIFAKKGLGRYKGENVVSAKRELLAVCRRLHGNGNLDDNASEDVLQGLKKSSVERFRSLFDAYYVRVTEANLMPGGARCWGHQDVYDEIVFIIGQAVELYHHMNMSHEYNVPKGHKFSYNSGQGSSDKPCWNCDKPGCRPDKCDLPRNEEKIQKNKEAFFKQRCKSGGGPGHGGPGRGGPGRGYSSGCGRGPGRCQEKQGGYSRGKWGAPTEAKEIHWHQGQPHVYCNQKKGDVKCGWNTTHNSEFHQVAMKDDFTVTGTLAKMAPHHHLVAAVQGQGLPDATPVSSLSGGSGGSLSLAASKDVMTRLTRSATSDDVRTALESAAKVLGLN